MKVSECF